MPRRPTPQQFELFTRPSDAALVPAPHWQTLPEEARATLSGRWISADAAADFAAYSKHRKPDR